MTRTARWALLFSSLGLFSFACSSGLTADPDGSGGNVMASGSGGRRTTSAGGGSSSGGHTLGGALNSGGSGNMGGAPPICEDGVTESCADHTPELPLGMATCTVDGWDLSACAYCAPDSELSCAKFDPKTPDGTLHCDADGLAWVEDPFDVCAPCDPKGEPIRCDSPGNPGLKRGGLASCSADGSYDFSECTLCDAQTAPPSCGEATDGARPIGTVVCDGGTIWNTVGCKECDPNDYEMTIKCLDLPQKEHAFSGGVAYCGTDSKWDQSSCQYCGDGIKNGNEQCEGSVSKGLTCDVVGFPGDSTSVETCNSDCTYDLTVCSLCQIEYTGKCLGQDDLDQDCNDASCVGRQCGTTVECDMACQWQKSCTGMSCNTGATCNVTCGGGGAQCEMNCLPGSNCNLVDGNSWTGNISGRFNCADRGECVYEFGVGPQGQIDTTIHCENGSSCEIISNEYDQDIGVIHCAAGAECVLTAPSGKESHFTLQCDAGSSCSPCPVGSTCDCSGAGCP